jgi:hypothetical protein|tara:strand:+ start:388 stop:1044 length:657 start_codon:yes stop_codon:yes gene_type:complete
MNINPVVVLILSLVLSVVSAGVIFVMNKDILKPPPKEEAVFTSVEFDADDTSYSPAETHSMNQLSKELTALKDKLLEREKELDSRESAISMEIESLDKQKQELTSLQAEVVKKLENFENNKGEELSEEQQKLYKDTSRRWIEMGPEVASIEIQSWRQNRRFDEALSIFETLKPDEKAPIIAFMYNSDEDSLIELADALSMRDRGLLPSSDNLGSPFQN